MSHFAEPQWDPLFPPFQRLNDHFGYVPGVFRAQALLPQLVQAEVSLLALLVFESQSFSPVQMELLLLMVSAAQRSQACFAHHYERLRLLSVPEARLDRILAGYREAALSPENTAMITFALSLAAGGPCVSEAALERLLAAGFTEEMAFQAVLTTALGAFLCCLTSGLGVVPDFAARPFPGLPAPPSEERTTESKKRSLAIVAPEADDLPCLRWRKEYGGLQMEQAKKLKDSAEGERAAQTRAGDAHAGKAGAQGHRRGKPLSPARRRTAVQHVGTKE